MVKSKTSLVWAFFNQEEDGDIFKNSCNFCLYSVPVPSRSKANTSNLLKHVKSRHSDVYEAELTRLNDEKAHALKSNTPITSFAVSLPQPSHSK